MKKNFLVFLAFTSIILAGCKFWGNEQKINENETGTAVLNYQVEQSRTIQAVDWALEEVSDMTVTFIKDSETVKPVSVNENKYVLLTGVYTINVTGSVTISGTPYSVSGQSTVTISAGTETPVTVYVGLSKTGTGNFEYTLTFTDAEADLPVSINENTVTTDGQNFEAYLTPVSDGDNIKLSCSLSKDDGETYDDETYYYVEGLSISTESSVTSGYYYLHVGYYWEDSTSYKYEYDLGDYLVEIADNITTTGSNSISSKLAAPVIYVTYDTDYKEGTYNGVTENYPMYIYTALKLISNRNDMESVYFYVTGSAPVQVTDDEGNSTSDDWYTFPLDLSQTIATGKTIYFKNHFTDIGLKADGTITGSYSKGYKFDFTSSEYTSSNSTAKFDLSSASNCPYILARENPNQYPYISVEIENVSSYYPKVIIEDSDDVSKYYTASACDFIFPADANGNDYSLAGKLGLYTYDDKGSKTEIDYIYNEHTEASAKYVTVYSKPDMNSEDSEGFKASLISTAKYTINETDTGTDLTSGIYFSHDSEGSVTFTADSIPEDSSVGWIVSDSDCGSKLLSTQSSCTINLSDYTTDSVFYCYSVTASPDDDGSYTYTYTYDKFELTLQLAGLFIDPVNDYFLYLDGENLIKGRGLWMGNDQNREAYLRAYLKVEEDNMTDAEKKTYDSLPDKALFASDYYDTYTFADNKLKDKDGNELYTFNNGYFQAEKTASVTIKNEATGESSTSEIPLDISLAKYDDSIMNYTSSDGYNLRNLVYYEATTPADLKTAAENVNSSSNNAILFICNDITVPSGTSAWRSDTSDTTAVNYKSYLEFTKTVYISGKNYGSEGSYQIDTTAAGLRVFDTSFTGYGTKLYTSNIKFVGSDISGTESAVNGGVLYLGCTANSCSFNFYDGTEITGGTANNGGGYYFTSNSSAGVYYRGNVKISNNTAKRLNDSSEDTGFGGGIYSYCGNAYTTLYSGVQITGNTAYKGGGFYNDYGYLNIDGGTISGNTAEFGGSGIFMSTSCKTIYGSVNTVTDEIMLYTYNFTASYLNAFPDNTASNPYVVYIDDSSPTISDIVSVLTSSSPDNSKKYVSLDLSYGTSLTALGDGDTDRAFFNCTTLVGIVLPSTLSTINTYAFDSCSNLKSITIPDSVTAIKDNAFEKCTSLTEITIPASVTTIGGYAFSGCTKLETVTFNSDTVPESLGGNIFSGCTVLKTIYVPTADGVEDYKKALEITDTSTITVSSVSN